MVETLLAMSGVVNRGVEMFKKGFVDIRFPEDGTPERQSIRDFLLLLASGILGILIVISGGPGVNILLGNEVYAGSAPIFGQVLTGILVGGGANAINWAASFLWGWKASPPSGSGSTMVKTETSTGSVTVEVEEEHPNPLSPMAPGSMG